VRVIPVRWPMAGWPGAPAVRDSQLVVVEVDGVRGIGESAPLPGRSRDDRAAMAWAVFVASCDAAARARGISMAALLGAPAPRVPLACVVWDAAQARAAVAAGARTLKLKLAGPDVRAAVAAVRDVRAAVGPDVRLRVDGNQTFAAADVATLVALLAPLVEYVEEPGPAPAPGTALDDSLVDGAPEAIDRFAAVVVKPTILGPWRTLALAARAPRAVISHALEGPVGLAACAELALVVGGTVAHGVAPHPGLAPWRIAIPTLHAGAVVDVPRVGTGLDLDAVLGAAERLCPHGGAG
jgi:L-Ala-D/L-Glu epimerase